MSMGHYWSFERAGLLGAPGRATSFLQSLDPNASPLAVTPIEAFTADLLSHHRIVAYTSLQAYQALLPYGNAVEAVCLDTVRYAGNYVANIAQAFVTPDGQPVYVGTANSTPAYYLPPTPSTPSHADWDLQFMLSPSSQPLHSKGLNSPVPQDAGGDTTNSIYAWVPVNVPRDAVGIAFQYQLTGASPNDYVTMGISNENYFTIEATFLRDAVWTATTVMDVSPYAGQQVQLFYSVNAVGTVPTGQLSVRGIHFYTVPPPPLGITLQGTNAVLAWPVTATGWQLETASTLSLTNQWNPITNTPATLDYQYVVTNGAPAGTKFYRLRK